MRTIDPAIFVRFKRWLAVQKDRDAVKRGRDASQAEIVQDLLEQGPLMWKIPRPESADPPTEGGAPRLRRPGSGLPRRAFAAPPQPFISSLSLSLSIRSFSRW